MHVRAKAMLLVVSLALLLAAAGGPSIAKDEPYGYCIDGVCGIGQISLEDAEFTDGDSDVITLTDDVDPAGLVVCLEGFDTCTEKADDVSIEDIALTLGGRVVFGQVDGDPTGTWDTTQLKTTLTCTVKGRSNKLPVKRTKDTAFIKRRGDGRLVTTSTTKGSKPTVMVRLAPGLYGVHENRKQGKDSVEIISFMGMVSDDEAKGTATMRYTTKAGGGKARCTAHRNYDMVRTGPSQGPETEAAVPSEEQSADPPAAGEDDGEAPAIVIDESEVEAIGGDAPAMVFEEDEVEE